MSLEENKALFRRFVEEVENQKNPDRIDEFFAADYLDHNPPPFGVPGIEGLKQAMQMFFSAFPDLHVEVEDLVAEGDKVVGRLTVTGTHQGEMMGIAATGKRISMAEIHIVRYSGGKVVEHWGIEDNMSMMQQLGVIPE
jgi:predicted ester cyclase